MPHRRLARMDASITLCLTLTLLAACAATLRAAEPPTVIRNDDVEGAKLRLSATEIVKVYLDEEDQGRVIRSTDNGQTWTKPEKTPKRWASKTLLDRDGQMHGFFIILRRVNETGNRINIDRFLDVWHVRTSGPDKAWEKGKMIQEGWNGSIVDDGIQLESGRIVQPSQDWVAGSKAGPPTGNGYALTLYSDDAGVTWHRSNPVKSPAYEGYNGANFGACEPSITMLNDGRIWMLVRTQAGYLYESFSRDGATWTEGRASVFYASTGPPALLRMPDNRLLLFWNNCEMPPRVDGDGVYGGRDALHVAISEDDGKTWRGFREILLDPRRHETPPKKGDRGTAYPYAVLSADGKYAEVTSGQGGHRVVMRIDPDWVLEKERGDDFASGLDNWSAFKGFGKATGWWRDRVVGPELIADPTNPDAMALNLRKPDDRDADGATWNFPAGHVGTLTMRVMFRDGHRGGVIALTDRFFEPCDPNVNRHAIYGLAVQPSGKLVNGNYTFPTDQWVELELAWDDAKRKCRVSVDGRTVAELPQAAKTVHGVSYLHLRSAADRVDEAGFLVGSVRSRVE